MIFMIVNGSMMGTFGEGDKALKWASHGQDCSKIPITKENIVILDGLAVHSPKFLQVNSLSILYWLGFYNIC